MGIRGELFSTKMTCEGRTYFFNVKQNTRGDVFLSIVESKPTEAETFDRRSIVVFRDDMRGFLKAFQTTLGFMEKPGTTPVTMNYSPEDPPPPRRKKVADPEGETGPAEKKRRVVVRKKPKAEDPGAAGGKD